MEKLIDIDSLDFIIKNYLNSNNINSFLQLDLLNKNYKDLKEILVNLNNLKITDISIGLLNDYDLMKLYNHILLFLL